MTSTPSTEHCVKACKYLIAKAIEEMIATHNRLNDCMGVYCLDGTMDTTSQDCATDIKNTIMELCATYQIDYNSLTVKLL